MSLVRYLINHAQNPRVHRKPQSRIHERQVKRPRHHQERGRPNHGRVQERKESREFQEERGAGRGALNRTKADAPLPVQVMVDARQECLHIEMEGHRRVKNVSREPGYYWCTVTWRSNPVPCYYSGVSWSFGDSEIKRPDEIGQRIEYP